MKKIINVFITALCLSSLSLSASDLVLEKPVLTLDGAKLIAEHAAKKANKEKWNVIISIVDSHGYLMYLERMDGVQLGSLDVAINKAKTSALYARPTKVFEERVKAGDVPVSMLANIVAIDGGLPIKVGGHIVGSIGVSGVRGNQDAEVAQAGIDAFLDSLDKK